jgi:ParB-like chromosome segregation protein Spo0J
MNTPKKIESLPISALVPFSGNSRTHSAEQVAQIAASIQEFGFTNPLLIDKDSVVIAGHGRLLAAQKLEMTEVPCIRLSHLSPTQVNALVLADNRIAMNAGWDEELLKVSLQGLTDEGFDTSLLGFSQAEIEKSLTDSLAEDEAPEDFKEVDENIDTEHQCPKCGYAWSGKSK